MKPHRLAAGAALLLLLSHAHGEQFYQTKTPYAPQQPAPATRRRRRLPAVYTQMLARHGSRAG
jgi:hypothetical protein